MFILKSKDTIQKAIKRAKKIKPFVRMVSLGRYEVTGSKGGFYTVLCRKDNLGNKTIACTCKAGEQGMPCFHAAAAVGLHVAVKLQRAEQ